MTERHVGYIVTLTEDLREDDAEALLTALRMLKGVAGVQPVVADMNTAMAMERARWELRAKLIEALR